MRVIEKSLILAAICVAMGGCGNCGAPPVVVQGELEASPSTIDFGVIEPRSAKQLALSITNRGEATARVTEFVLSGDGAAQFSVRPNEAASVAKGEALALTVVFSPPELGSFSAILTIRSDASKTPELTVRLQGGAASSDPCYGVKCQTPPNACFREQGVCSNGNCSYIPMTGNPPCDDSNACTTGESCDSAGVCGGGTSKSCQTPPASPVCVSARVQRTYQPMGTCAAATGQCSYAFVDQMCQNDCDTATGACICGPGQHACDTGCCPWRLEDVGGLNAGFADVDTYTSLAIDQQGNPHIAAIETSTVTLKYIRRVGTNLSVQNVTTGGPASVSLALNTAGRPMIVYPAIIAKDLRTSTLLMNGWMEEVADSAFDRAAFFATVALDKTTNQRPHLAYRAPNGVVRYVVAGSSQIPTMIGTTSTEHASRMLAVDNANVPHLVFVTTNTGDLVYVSLTGSNWPVETVSQPGETADFVSVAIDPMNQAHVVYYDSASHSLKYAQRNVGTPAVWTRETIDAVTGGDVGQWASLAVDARQIPHVAYTDAMTGELKYARRQGRRWEKMVVDSRQLPIKFCSIALDKDGLPHMSYFDTNRTLKYARY